MNEESIVGLIVFYLAIIFVVFSLFSVMEDYNDEHH